jgi:mycofactocin precursor
MDETTTFDVPTDDAPVALDAATSEATDDVDEELLIEEVSIDGMCGVY